jgi:SAM-dependent methyltransferase
MSDYLILISPSANRVYADTSVQLMKSEIQVFNDAVLDGKIHDLSDRTLGGVPYISIRADELADSDIAFLSNLSSLYALFEVRGELLRPLTVAPLDKFSSDLLTIQKYSGKTNEHFTKLLLNVTAISTDSPHHFLTGALKVVDPICGRGTTLNQAMMYGFDASGLDLDGKDFDAYSVFIRTWLKNKRIKHQAEVVPIRRNREQLGRRLEIGLGVTKEQYKAGEVLKITYVNADTLRSSEFFKTDSFDVLVADTPYGVRHGSHQERLSRSPLQLLEYAVPDWVKLVRPGGTIGLSWNTYVARREELAAILEDNGCDVLDSAGFDGFKHRVDQAINRDLVVARNR